jgi:hypothetical protein
VLVRNWKNWNSRALLVEIKNDGVTVTDTKRKKKVKTGLLSDLAIPLLGQYLEELEAEGQRDI